MLSLKDLLVKHENGIILFLGVLLLSIISYGIGRLSSPYPKEPITIEADTQLLPLIQEVKTNLEDGVGKEKVIGDIPVKSSPLTVDIDNESQGKSIKSPATNTKKQGLYLASKSGTKYHRPSCPGAKRIKEENKIWFNSKEEAERAGYSPAKNCNGI